MSGSTEHEINSDDYSMRDDQRAAMEELERLQKVSPNDWNDERDQQFFQLLMEPPVDYEDTVARLEALNAQLEQEPMPPGDSERHSRIRFSEELVQVAPSPSPPPPVEAVYESPREATSSHDTSANDAVDSATEGDADEGSSHGDSSHGLEGTFSPRSDSVKSAEAAGNNDNGIKDKPALIKDSRADGGGRGGSATGPRPSTSASEVSRDDSGFQIWLHSKSDQQRQEERREVERQRRQEVAEERARQKRTSKLKSFGAWLDEKRDQSEREERQRREALEAEERQREEETRKKRINQPTFDQWLAGKRAQSARERVYTRAEQKERLGSGRRDTPRQANRSYRLWLRRKNEQEFREAQEMQQRLRIARLALRRTRRSQELANALTAASSYRYLDYYGYR